MQGLKRVSEFHRELAKRIARGDTNKQIMGEIKISASRLSILKSNPLFRNIVDDYRTKLDDKFYQAHAFLEQKVVHVAQELVNCATNPAIQPKDRIVAGFGILDRVGLARGQSTKPGRGAGGQEIVFEQMLRVVKRQMNGPEDDTSQETADALAQLEQLSGSDYDDDAEFTELDPESDPNQPNN